MAKCFSGDEFSYRHQNGVESRDEEEAAEAGKEYLDSVSSDPVEVGKELLDALMKSFEAIDKRKERHEEVLRKFDTMAQFRMGNFDYDEVETHRVTLTHKWSGTLTEGT